jgi:hypothetical protein
MFEADALQQGAEAAGELAYQLYRLVASFAHCVGCAELPGQRDPVGMPAQDGDLLGAEALDGDHAAQATGAVTDNRHGFPRTDFGGDGRVMAGPPHV